MWTNVAILLFFVLFFLAVGLLKQQEGFSNPVTENQLQQGDLATLKNQLKQITINEIGLSEFQTQITQLSDQTTKLQNNVPDGQVNKYAPD